MPFATLNPIANALHPPEPCLNAQAKKKKKGKKGKKGKGKKK